MASLLAIDLDHVLEHTEPVWSALRGERVFLTGGTGFFGQWLLESLVRANERLGSNVKAVVLTRDPQSFANKSPNLASHANIELVAGDIRSFPFPSGAFSHVVHAATQSSVALNTEHPDVMLDTIVAGTARALEFSAACGARRFLHTSSGAAYGKQPPELTHVPETHAGGPDTMNTISAYGEGKRVAELLGTIHSRTYGIETIQARCFTFVGPHLPLDGAFAIGNFIRDGLQQNTIQISGDGTPYRSYLYSADLAIWLWTLLIRGESCRVYNVGSDEDLAIAALAEKVRAAFGHSVEVVIHKQPTPGNRPERYVPDIARCRSELGLEPWIGLDEAISRTIAWHRSAAQKSS